MVNEGEIPEGAAILCQRLGRRITSMTECLARCLRCHCSPGIEDPPGLSIRQLLICICMDFANAAARNPNDS